jgi:hypothetical protein
LQSNNYAILQHNNHSTLQRNKPQSHVLRNAIESQ